MQDHLADNTMFHYSASTDARADAGESLRGNERGPGSFKRFVVFFMLRGNVLAKELSFALALQPIRGPRLEKLQCGVLVPSKGSSSFLGSVPDSIGWTTVTCRASHRILDYCRVRWLPT